eukprot:1240384-Amphidinium_carterae.1
MRGKLVRTLTCPLDGEGNILASTYLLLQAVAGECGGIATNTKEGWKFGSEVPNATAAGSHSNNSSNAHEIVFTVP